jgi:phosphatidylserine/phosphatidylglycerophosphate/cardiolipin synthase-like enzyme
MIASWIRSSLPAAVEHWKRECRLRSLRRYGRTYVWVDAKVAIAHNKVMVIDGTIVITDSFNFAAAAQTHNAENLLILEDYALAAKYRANWERRRAVSEPYAGALPAAPSPTIGAE